MATQTRVGWPLPLVGVVGVVAALVGRGRPDRGQRQQMLGLGLVGALLAVPLQPESDDRAASWQPFADYLSTKGVETLYNCGFESVATACPEVASDLVPERGYGAASDLLVPPGEHVLLIGSSHMRSVAEVIMAAHRFSNDEPEILHGHDSDDCFLNQTEAEVRQWSQTHTGHHSTCGLFDGLWEGQKRVGNNVACQQSDHYTARFPSGAALTVTANYANWQLGDDDPKALDSVRKFIEETEDITHVVYGPHHDKSWFYARCEAGGKPLDPDKSGIDHAREIPGVCEFDVGHVEECIRARPLFRLLSEELPGRVTLLMTHTSFDKIAEEELLKLDAGARPAIWLLPELRKFPCLLKDQTSAHVFSSDADRPGVYTGPCLERATTLNETLDCLWGHNQHACIAACDQGGCHLGPGVVFAQFALADVKDAAQDDGGADAGYASLQEVLPEDVG